MYKGMTQIGSALERSQEMCRTLRGWKRWLLAFALGSGTAASLPPVFFWPILIISFTGLVWLLDGVAEQNEVKTKDRYNAALAIGWWFGFGYFLFGLYWIAWAFLVDAQTFAWLIPLAASLMPSILALFIGAAVTLAMTVWRKGPWRVFVLAVCWTSFEWLRGHIFTGFPWNLIGYSATASLEISQTAAVIGTYGLSMLVVLASASFALLGDRDNQARRNFVYPLVALVGFSILWGAGSIRLAVNKTQYVDGVQLRIVQPSISQADKWRPEFRQIVFREYLDLMQSSGYDSRTHIIWPESALPFALTQSEAALTEIIKSLGSNRILLTGAVRVGYKDKPNEYELYNSVHVIKGQDQETGHPVDQVIQTYDKYHLVPFGEYVPFADIFRRMGLRPIVDQVDGFSAGTSRKTLAIPNANLVSPLICYEIIFPRELTAPGDRPDWIVNVTNDAWYGNTSGPRQHLVSARMRAIESGLPVIRSANTGISAVFDPLGRTVGKLALNEKGVLDAPLPKSGANTLYQRIGDLFLGLCVVCALIYAAMQNRRSNASTSDR